MSSPLVTAQGRRKPGRRRRAPIRAVVNATIAAAVILSGVGALFATGVVYVTTGTLSSRLAHVSLYVARDGWDLTAIRASDGAVLWSHWGGGWYTAAADGLVFTSSSDTSPVFALRGSDGSQVWSDFNVGDVLAAGDGLVVVGWFDGQDPSQVTALNAADGSLRWSYLLDGANRPNATLVGTTVYVYGAGGSDASSASDVLFALRATDGKLLWKMTTRSSGSPAPAVGDGAVYVADDDGYVNAVRASDGVPLWRVRIGAMGSGAGSSLATGPGAVYASSSDGNIVALRDATGVTLWRHRADPASAPTAADGVVYVNTLEGDLLALNANNGMQLWSAQVHGLLAQFGDPRPLVVAGGVFEGVSGACRIICREAYVYGLRASDGAVAWRVLTPHILTALVVA